MNPVISCFGAAIRTDKWIRFYDSLSTNKTSFEVIFIGDKRPDFTLPDNMRFIYSTVKPAQCAHIGFLYAKGDYFVHAVDDCVYNDRALDRLLKTLRKQGEDKTYVTPRYKTFRPYKKRGRKREQLAGFVRIKPKKGKHPLLPVGGIISRKLWEKIDGVDRRFICSDWEFDQAMRLWQAGGQVTICKKAMITEIRETPNPALLPHDHKDYDRALFYSFWCVSSKNPRQRYTPDNLMPPMTKKTPPYKYKVVNTRSVPFEPYEETADILTKTQGPKGIW
ncbi:hypothetical protein LCGC14_1274460 [marine sediment metagenome]|uniref:Glycosyltransferase 2-like domain-containing protein n=1 Tax=marine sediment metagenome TaxID=412755 RepID=A0A0F9KYU1_9ZZZZ